ncbi:hypothetical protein ABGN05_13925 [Aquibium sp. LZ166]|uniref:Uncharacterized protein n=1 Tax=Aquibium pacificus TaxID=3153579 RepID=A0ABV3SJ17_9HYPH
MTSAEKKNPVRLPGAHRVDVKKLGGSIDSNNDTLAVRRRQAAHLLNAYNLSFDLALVLAEHAFQSGR